MIETTFVPFLVCRESNQPEILKALSDMGQYKSGRDVIAKYKATVYNMISIEVAGQEGGNFNPIEKVIYWNPNQMFVMDGANIQLTKDKVVDQSLRQKSSTPYPAWVTLAHEMGHVIQAFESGKGLDVWKDYYNNNQQLVEMDNIKKYEWPIVEELGLVKRGKY